MESTIKDVITWIDDYLDAQTHTYDVVEDIESDEHDEQTDSTDWFAVHMEMLMNA